MRRRAWSTGRRSGCAAASGTRCSVGPAMPRDCCPDWSSATPAGWILASQEAMRSSGLTHLTAVSGSNVAIVCGTALLLARRLGLPRRLRAAAGRGPAGGLRDRRPARAQRAAGGRHGGCRAARAGHRARSPWPAGAVGGDPRAARGRPVAQPVVRLRAVDARHARAAAVRPGVGGAAVTVDAPAGGVRAGRPARGSGRLRAGHRAAAGFGLARLRARQPRRGASGRARHDRRASRRQRSPSRRPRSPTSSHGPVSLPAEGIAAVARVAGRAPALPWPGGGAGALSLAVLTAAVDRGRRRRPPGPACATPGRPPSFVPVLVAGIWPVGSTGWPPPGWVMVMCDVGQGDGLVLSTGPGRAIVVDTGPDPALMTRCLAPTAHPRGRPAGAHPRPRRPRRGRSGGPARPAGPRAADERAERPSGGGQAGRPLGLRRAPARAHGPRRGHRARSAG